MVEIPDPRDVLSHEDKIESYQFCKDGKYIWINLHEKKEQTNYLFLVNERFHIFEWTPYIFVGWRLSWEQEE